MINLFSLKEMGIKTRKSTRNEVLNSANPFLPIGIGKPLTIRLHTLYTGNLKNGLFNNKQSVMLTSQMKDDMTFDAAPRAIHQLYSKVGDRSILFPNAGTEGTSLIYYNKAFDKQLLHVTLDLKASRLNDKAVNNVANALNLAAGIPVFAPYAPYLMAGSQIIKVGNDVVTAIVESSPLMSYSFDIASNLGGLIDSEAGFYIGCSPKHKAKLNGYKMHELDRNQLVLGMSKDIIYDGDIPYVIISIDGKSSPEYEAFNTSISSAGLLRRFSGSAENTSSADLHKVLEIYNDYQYTQKIQEINQRIKTASASDREQLENLRNAYKLNIINPNLFK